MITDKKNKIILVSGATGQQGSSVTKSLLKAGFSVRALTRDKSKDAAKALEKLGAELVEGDFENADSIAQALKGVYGAYSVQNTWVIGTEKEIQFGKSFADAALKAGVKHFVYSSVGGAERKTGISHFDSKFTVEEYVRSIGIPATILRPVFFMENWLHSLKDIRDGKIINALSPETKLQEIAVHDIGVFAALVLSDPDHWLGKAVEIAGDELTMPEVARAWSKVLGIEVKYIQVSWDEFQKAMGKEYTVMNRWFEDKGYEADIPALKKMVPELVNYETFLKGLSL